AGNEDRRARERSPRTDIKPGPTRVSIRSGRLLTRLWARASRPCFALVAIRVGRGGRVGRCGRASIYARVHRLKVVGFSPRGIENASQSCWIQTRTYHIAPPLAAAEHGDFAHHGRAHRNHGSESHGA